MSRLDDEISLRTYIYIYLYLDPYGKESNRVTHVMGVKGDT